MVLKIYLMKTPWMTTLFSKGLQKGFEAESLVRERITGVQNQIKKELETRGLRLTAADLAALIEDVSPLASRSYVALALQYIRPFAKNLGLRVTKLTDTQAEVVIPHRTRNGHEDGALHEGALIAGGQEAYQLLWTRHAPLGTFRFALKAVSLQRHNPAHGDVRARFELSEATRESLLSLLRENHRASHEGLIYFFDENEQAVAEMTVNYELSYQPALESSGE